MSINQDKMSVTLNIDWATFGPISGATSYVGTVKTYQITGFTSKLRLLILAMSVKMLLVSLYSFLMEDNTVSYMPMFILKKIHKVMVIPK